MRLVLTLFFTLSSSPSIAQGENDWLGDLPLIIHNVINTNTTQKKKCEVSERRFNSSVTNEGGANPYQKCLEVVCGKPDSTPSLVTLWNKDYEELASESIEEIKKKPMANVISTKIKEYYELEDSLFSKENKNEVLKLLDNPLENIDGSLANLGGYIAANEIDSILDGSSLNRSSGLYDISLVFSRLVKFKGEFSKRKSQRIEKIHLKIKEKLNAPGEKYRESSVEDFIKAKYSKEPDIDMKEGLLRYMDELIEIMNKSPQNLTLINKGKSHQLLDLVSTKAGIQNDLLSSAEIMIALAEAKDIEMYGLIYDYQDTYRQEIAEESGERLKKLLESKNKVEIKKILEKTLRNEEVHERNDSALKDDIEFCLDAYNRNVKLLPSDEKVQKMKVLAEEARSKFADKILSLKSISDKSKKYFVGKKFGTSRINMPLSKSHYQKALIRSIDKKILDKRKVIETNKFNLGIKPHFSSILYNALYPEEFPMKNSRVNEDLSNICAALEQEPFSDRTFTFSGAVKLSYTLASSTQDEQREVITHEFAHNFEEILGGVSSETSSTFDDLKQCITANQKMATGTNDPTKFFPEDFADWISNKTVEKFEKSFFCQMLGVDKDSGEYQYNTIYSEGEDDHSTIIYRLLRYYLDKGEKIPKECHDGLRSEDVLSIGGVCSLD